MNRIMYQASCVSSFAYATETSFLFFLEAVLKFVYLSDAHVLVIVTASFDLLTNFVTSFEITFLARDAFWLSIKY